MFKRILIALGIVLVLIQFIRPKKNEEGGFKYAVYTKHNMPPEVSDVLKRGCLNCHSNVTKYPWYSNVQPVAWFLANHIKEAKEGLNFSEFTNHRIAYQNHKFEEIAEVVKEKEMPLPSYTWFGLHPEAKLTDAEREILIVWAQSQMAMIAAKYPADSLVMKKR